MPGLRGFDAAVPVWWGWVIVDDLNRRFHYLRETFRDNWTEPANEPRYFEAELEKIYMDRLKLYRERFRKLAEDLESYAQDTGYIPHVQQEWAQMAAYLRAASEVGIPEVEKAPY